MKKLFILVVFAFVLTGCLRSQKLSDHQADEIYQDLLLALVSLSEYNYTYSYIDFESPNQTIVNVYDGVQEMYYVYNDNSQYYKDGILYQNIANNKGKTQYDFNDLPYNQQVIDVIDLVNTISENYIKEYFALDFVGLFNNYYRTQLQIEFTLDKIIEDDLLSEITELYFYATFNDNGFQQLYISFLSSNSVEVYQIGYISTISKINFPKDLKNYPDL